MLLRTDTDFTYNHIQLAISSKYAKYLCGVLWLSLKIRVRAKNWEFMNIIKQEGAEKQSHVFTVYYCKLFFKEILSCIS